MGKPSSFADVELDVEARPKPWLERPEAETPFRLLVVGDFSGGANRSPRPIPIDRDNFDQVLAKVRPEVTLPVAGTLRFTELEDFHPDRIFEQAELFRALRAARANPPQPPASALPSPRPGKVTLDDLLGETSAARPQPALDDWGRLVRDLVAPYLVAGADPRQAEVVRQIDRAIAEQMRSLLRHPEFQQLEAAWRAAFFLVRRLETGPDLKIYLLDVSKAELARQLEQAREDLRKCAFYQVVVEETTGTPGAEPWAALAANYSFDGTEGDLELLARLGSIAQKAGAPVIAGASEALLGSIAGGGWTMLRKLPLADWIGLAMPRFLLRLPYGGDTSPIERFEFEEMAEHEHSAYLWGNAAFACACLLGEAFSRSGWDMRPGEVRQLAGLPLHVYREDEETRNQPCAELLMTEEQAEALLDNGIMPLASLKDQDAMLLVRFQSIADPPAALAGRWR